MEKSVSNGIKKLELLEGMRAVAATWVLVDHAKLAVDYFVGSTGNAYLIANGHLGVDFFFVLSGFIITFSVSKIFDAPGGFRQYIRARAVRVYVPYWPIGIGMLLLYAALPSLSAADRTPGAISSLFLVPTNAPPALSVAWTLIHEILFYSLFSLAFFSKRVFGAALFLWAAVIVVVWFANPDMGRALRYVTSPRNLCFFLGIGVFLLRRYQRPVPVDVGLGIFGLAIVLVQSLLPEPSHLWASIGFALLVSTAASRRFEGVRIGVVAATLGTASYSIYLVHNPVLSVLVRAARPLGIHSPWLALLLVSIASLGISVAYWAIYERRALRLANDWTKKGGKKETPAASPAPSP